MTNYRPLTRLIVVLLVLAVVGCAATPEDRWYQQRESLNTANRIYLAHVPTMNDEQIVHYGELLQTARAHLDAAKAQLPEGGSSFDTALDLIESILVRIVALDASDASAVPPTPTDNPLTEITPNERP
jgi:hypothetical protein